MKKLTPIERNTNPQKPKPTLEDRLSKIENALLKSGILK